MSNQKYKIITEKNIVLKLIQCPSGAIILVADNNEDDWLLWINATGTEVEIDKYKFDKLGTNVTIINSN